jgi:transporter family protein
MARGIVLVTGKHHGIAGITPKNWLFLGLSGAATGLSWLFYYRALQIGDASKVVPIDKLNVVIAMILAFVLFGEALTAKAVIGGLPIAAGSLLLIL